MPKVSLNRLTRREVETSKPGRLSDGGGLVLQTAPAGSRSWLFIYRWGDKRPEVGLGAFPAVSLAQARTTALTLQGSQVRTLYRPPLLPTE